MALLERKVVRAIGSADAYNSERLLVVGRVRVITWMWCSPSQLV